MKTRNTAQKRAIFSLLAARRDHPSATTLYEDLKELHPTLSKATVYRVLKNAADEGEILRIHAGTEDHFDAHTQDHCHLICSVCDAIFDAPPPDFSLSELEKATGYQILSRHLEFHGICPNCQSQRKKS